MAKKLKARNAHINFYVEGMSKDIADQLFDVICLFVGSHGLTVVGAVEMETDKEAGKEQDVKEVQDRRRLPHLGRVRKVR